jgi:hypothetical protein
MAIRTTEQLAPEQLAKLTTQLTQLTTAQPTTTEIDEALALLPQIQQVLKDWINSRHIIAAHARQAAEFRECFPHVAAAMDRLTLRQIAADVCSPELDAALDEWEERQNRIHPTFAPLLAPFQRFA